MPGGCMLLYSFVVLLEICIYIITFYDPARITLFGCLKHCLYFTYTKLYQGH